MNLPSISFPQIQSIPRPETIQNPSTNVDGASAFRQLLDHSVRTITEQQDSANAAVDKFLQGEDQDPHKMMMAVQRADLAFDMFVQVRNKVLQAYQEVMRMPE